VHGEFRQLDGSRFVVFGNKRLGFLFGGEVPCDAFPVSDSAAGTRTRQQFLGPKKLGFTGVIFPDL
jgi:hypothetical protein